MQSFGRTDVGIVRSVNQDYIYVNDNPVGPLPNLYIVADGMGGHNAGDFASRYTVETFISKTQSAEKESTYSIIRLIDESISPESLLEESFDNDLLEYPQYTRPY